MKKGLVSIIIPVYNVEKYIRECIESCITQTYKNIEIICIDDESTDGSLSILEEYKEKIAIIKQNNAGVSVARNEGLKRANGEWVIFVDGDDWLEKDAIEKMISEVNDKKIDILITDYYLERPNASTRINFFCKTNIDVFDKNGILELVKNCILKTKLSNPKSPTNVGVPWGKLYNKKFLSDNNCHFVTGLKRMQDSIFNINAFYNSQNIAIRNIYSYHYRQQESSATKRYSPDFDDTSLRVLEEIAAFMKKNSLNNELKTVYYSKALKLLLEIIKLKYAPVANGKKRKEKIKEIKKLTSKDIFRKSIQTNKNEYLTIKEKIQKRLLRANATNLLLTIYILYYRTRRQKLYRASR